jgi:FkbM family methyltransferase
MKSLRRIAGDILRALRTAGRTDDRSAIQRQFALLRQPKYQAGEIRWRNKSLRYTDGPALYYQLTDIYLGQVYDFGCTHPNPRILDIGANLGLASIRFRELHPAARITAFEADPAIAAVLQKNLHAFDDHTTEIIAAAAWTQNGQAGFQSNGDDSGQLNADASLQIRTVDLSEYCREPVDFLKMDVEGAEFELIAHLHSTGTLANIQRMFIELHAWNATTPVRFHELLTTLTTNGFHYRLTSAVTFPATERGMKFDALVGSTNLVNVHAWRDGISPQPMRA